MKLTAREVANLNQYVSFHPLAIVFEIIQGRSSGIGLTTYVQVENQPETKTDITDYSVW